MKVNDPCVVLEPHMLPRSTKMSNDTVAESYDVTVARSLPRGCSMHLRIEPKLIRTALNLSHRVEVATWKLKGHRMEH